MSQLAPDLIATKSSPKLAKKPKKGIQFLEIHGIDLNEASERIIRAKEAQRILSISPAAFYRKASQDPNFPKPVNFGQKSKGYLMSEIRAYILAKVKERDEALKSNQREG